MKVKSLSRARLCATPWTATYQALRSMGFSRQEYCSGVPLPSLKIQNRQYQTLTRAWSKRNSHPLLGPLSYRVKHTHHTTQQSCSYIFTKGVGFPRSSAGKESACNAGDPRSIPGSRRSPGEGKGYPFQYSGLENSTIGSQRVEHD